MDIQEVYQSSNFLLHREENVLRYQKGGYHPVSLDDTFKNGRYEIKHKLGHGGFSTVWVARDLELGQWVSLKIIVAEESEQSHELNILQALLLQSEADLPSHHVVQLLDSFSHTGPNGCHQCLVFELLGPTVDVIVNDAHEYGDRIDIEVVLSMSIQLLEAKSFVQHLGYAFGDLSPRNICCVSSCLSRLSESELMEVLGPTESDDLVRVDGKALATGVPKCLIQSTQWTGWPHEDEESDDDIRVIDLGHAFRAVDMPTSLPQPGGLQAPETLFTGKIDSNIDLWRIGLVIYYLTFGALPFQYYTTADLVESMVAFLGGIPHKWRSKLNETERSPEQNTGLSDWDDASRPRLEELIADSALDETTKGLLAVVKGLMRFVPQDRMPASIALDLVRDLHRNLVDQAKAEG